MRFGVGGVGVGLGVGLGLVGLIQLGIRGFRVPSAQLVEGWLRVAGGGLRVA